MDGEPVPMRIPQNDPMAMELRLAVRGGDLATVGRLLAERPGLARARFVGRNEGTRTLLHFAADWPGYFPNGAEMVRLMVSAGADPSAPATGGDAETPLHWAASSDDVDVAAALIDAGADIESTGGTIGAGPPLANAVGYGCWHVARLLVARGARVGSLWEAAALGDRPEGRLYTAIARATGARGNTTALVGTPEQVAEVFGDYYDLGVSHFLIRGFDPLIDAIEYGRELIPLTRKLIAERDSSRGVAAE